MQSPDRSIDESLSRNQPVPAPSYRLAVLRHGAMGPRLAHELAPALRDGWVSPAELRGTPYGQHLGLLVCVLP